MSKFCLYKQRQFFLEFRQINFNDSLNVWEIDFFCSPYIQLKKIFLAFGNSNNKKSAETSVPTVVGSVFNYGAVAVSSVIGFAIGMGAMAFIKRKKVNKA